MTCKTLQSFIPWLESQAMEGTPLASSLVVIMLAMGNICGKLPGSCLVGEDRPPLRLPNDTQGGCFFSKCHLTNLKEKRQRGNCHQPGGFLNLLTYKQNYVESTNGELISHCCD